MIDESSINQTINDDAPDAIKKFLERWSTEISIIEPPSLVYGVEYIIPMGVLLLNPFKQIPLTIAYEQYPSCVFVNAKIPKKESL